MPVDFFFLGPQKTGTTWLFENLKNHPQLIVPKEPIKETRYFDLHFEKGAAWYENYFQSKSQDQFWVEFAPSYFDLGKIPQRIFDYNPKARLVVGIRPPVDLAESMYNHQLKKLKTRGSLKEAIHAEPRILEIARYSHFLEEWKKFYPEQNLHCYNFSDIAEHPQKLLEEVCNFFGIENPRISESITEKVNATAQPKSGVLQKVRRGVYQTLKRNQMHGAMRWFSNVSKPLTQMNTKSEKVRLTAGERSWLEQELSEEIAFSKKLLG